MVVAAVVVVVVIAAVLVGAVIETRHDCGCGFECDGQRVLAEWWWAMRKQER